MRKYLHRLFPHYIAPPPVPREPTDLERLEARIKKQRTVSIEAEITSLMAMADARREQVLLEQLEELCRCVTKPTPKFPRIDQATAEVSDIISDIINRTKS